MSELAQLKSVLRSLVVSSPACVDARALLRDYRSMMGEALPAARHGYRDPLQFLRERCADCFLFSGPTNNPVLTPIVPESLRHIDDFVQKQRSTTKTTRFMGKRRSVPETHRSEPPRQNNLVAQTFKPPVRKAPMFEGPSDDSMARPRPEPTPAGAAQPARPEAGAQPRRPDVAPPAHKPELAVRAKEPEVVARVCKPELALRAKEPRSAASDATKRMANGDCNGQDEDGERGDGMCSRRMLRRRPPERRADSADSRDDDSGRHTASSGSGKRSALERLGDDVARLLADSAHGVWASQLPRLYEERFGRELNYARLGFASIAACACALAGVRAARAPDGDWLLRDARAPGAGPDAAPGAAPSAAPRRRAAARAAAPAAPDPEDALPGIDYDADVFPADCLSFTESIPARGVARVRPGDMLPLVVGEVYSPSHLWVLLLGPDYDQMEDFMDEMTEYYTKGEGATRVLAAGARRPGQYCSSVYEGDWHRSLIVQVVDSETVKVRHVDYGTVDTVAARALRPLRRRWAGLAAQAVRARLAGLRPPAASRRWPRAAAAYCLQLVKDRRLVGNVVAVDHEEGILELLLIDTATAEDVNVTDELVSAGHADPRPRPALGAEESYLFPLFAALEAGATPNYAEIHALLRDGIALDYVEAYRRHVPALLPAPAPAPPALTRVPLLWAAERAPPPARPPEDREEPKPAPGPQPVPGPQPAPSQEPADAPSPAPEPDVEAPALAGPSTPPAPPSAAAAPPLPGYTPRPVRPAPPRPPPAPHPPAFYAVPQPCYRAFFPQFAAPGPPPPPYAAGPPLLQFRAGAPPPWARDVRLSAAECEVFELLSRVDRNAAHRYVAEALRRARGPPAPGLDPLAAEFRAARAPGLDPFAAEFRAAGPRPPPGFDDQRPFARHY